MRISFVNDRILAVMAHPDDCEIVCAGTLARAKQDGAKIAICVMCAGDKGWRAGGSADGFSKVRRSEASEAATVLGAELHWIGLPDGELTNDLVTRQHLVNVYRNFKPSLVIAHSPDDYHPDHVATAAVAEAASWFSASRGWHVTYQPALDAPPAVWFADTINMIDFAPEFYVDVSEQVSMKKQMLACHQSQLGRAGDRDFAPLMDLMLRQCQARGAQAGVEAAEAFRSYQAFKRVHAW